MNSVQGVMPDVNLRTYERRPELSREDLTKYNREYYERISKQKLRESRFAGMSNELLRKWERRYAELLDTVRAEKQKRVQRVPAGSRFDYIGAFDMSGSLNWTQEQLDAHMRQFSGTDKPREVDPATIRKTRTVRSQPNNKFGARKKEVDGHVFDSTSEALAYQVVRQWEMAGEIRGLELQPEYLLQEGYRDADGKWRRAIKYRADFRWTEGDGVSYRVVVTDVKGMITPVFAIKEKLFRLKFPEIKFQVWNREKVRDLAR